MVCPTLCLLHICIVMLHSPASISYTDKKNCRLPSNESACTCSFPVGQIQLISAFSSFLHWMRIISTLSTQTTFNHIFWDLAESTHKIKSKSMNKIILIGLVRNLVDNLASASTPCFCHCWTTMEWHCFLSNLLCFYVESHN